MIKVKGKYNGESVVLEELPPINECDVIVTFLEKTNGNSFLDDGSLEFLFKDYIDDGVREPIVDFGLAVGNERW
jgi:hypothetical protein